MTMVESKPKSSITFHVPSLSVTNSASSRGDSPDHHHFAGAAGQLSPHPLPRPPRCLTPYPDTSSFSHSLEPSPLSSPAFSAYSMSITGDESEMEDEAEGRKAVSKPISSPVAAPRADNARLLAPALHMSHLNSPTDIKFRELPLSPMRKIKPGAATPSPLVDPPRSPEQMPDEGPVEKMKKKPGPIQLSLKRITTRIPSRSDRKQSISGSEQMTEDSVHAHVFHDMGDRQESLSAESTAMPKTSRRVGNGAAQGGTKAYQELQVHVETVD